MAHRHFLVGLVAGVAAGPVAAQIRTVSRADAVAAAIANGPRLAVARTDSSAAAATVMMAREFGNPTIGFQYTEDTPRHHYTADVPLDLPWLRSPRVAAARAGRDAALLRFAFEREAVGYEADTAYTHAVAAAARARLSARSARDADSLAALARLRRDAGDASELDVQLALLSAGQLANGSAADSAEAADAVVAVQALMGLPATTPIALADTLEPGPAAESIAAAVPLLVSAAESSLASAERALAFERRSLFVAPSLSLGWESRDPGGSGDRMLPTIGLGIQIPLFNRNQGAIRLAGAARDRARAELSFVRLESGAALAKAERELVVARGRLTRSERLVGAADRVAALSLLAYQEGAAGLPAVLEAQRTARETMAQHIDDIAAVRNAAGLVRLLTSTGKSLDR